METKTYGVAGLMDWQAEIPVGKAKMKVHFTGGTMTQYGVSPAEYTTDSKLVQSIIERSSYYKDGRIKLMRVTGEPEPTKVEVTETVAEEPAAEAEEADVTETEEDVEPTKVEVTCLTDAQVYLKEHFGISSTKARSKAAAQQLAQQNGVVFVGLD